MFRPFSGNKFISGSGNQGMTASLPVIEYANERGKSREGISRTIVNALAIVSGIVCDGAKPSCAAKIAFAVDAGILGFEMTNNGQQFCSGDGIIASSVENTIRNIGLLARDGMKVTDKEIIRMMLDE